jgi:peptidylprolyl isomerase
VVEVVITDLTDSHVTLDANHPLAGRDLTFELELVSIS